jgi:hypothetical protein
VLSVHDTFHADALEKNLDRLRPDGLEESMRQRLCAIISTMCAYKEAARPDHQTVIDLLDAFLRDAGIPPDLKDFATKLVLPLFRDRTHTRPIDHPGYPDLAFLDRTKVNSTGTVEPDVNAQLRELLATDDWHTRLDEIELMLVRNPHWTVDPFVDALPDGVRPWWRFWKRDRHVATAQLVALLDYVSRAPPSGDIRRRLLSLREHPDDTVQIAVGNLLAME